MRAKALSKTMISLEYAIWNRITRLQNCGSTHSSASVLSDNDCGGMRVIVARIQGVVRLVDFSETNHVCEFRR